MHDFGSPLPAQAANHATLQAQPHSTGWHPLAAAASRRPTPTPRPCLAPPPRVFGGDRIKGLMVAFQIEDLPMESQMLTDALDTAQKRVESYFYDIRK